MAEQSAGEMQRLRARLMPKEPEIELYKTGFGDDDFMGRKTAGKRLSELLERFDDPMVVAVEGIWGSGKSYFLKRWVGAHVAENGGKAAVVYFDAFRYDFLDDPLIALTMAIDERLAETMPPTVREEFRRLASKYLGRAIRIGMTLATSAVSAFVPAVAAAAVDALNDEVKSATAYWEREKGRHDAVDELRKAFARLTAADNDNPDGRRLIVVVDELDRCRPDYALGVLEVIKHFFAAPRMHFVLGVNRDALEDMVRVRYGAGVRAGDYLKRFITLSMALPDMTEGAVALPSAIAYLRRVGTDMLLGEKILGQTANAVALIQRGNPVSLRDVEHILREMAVLPGEAEWGGGYTVGWPALIAGAVAIKIVRPEIYQKLLRGRLEIEDIKSAFSITEAEINKSKSTDHEARIVAFDHYWSWCYALTGKGFDEGGTEHLMQQFGVANTEALRILPVLKRRYLSSFQLPT